VKLHELKAPKGRRGVKRLGRGTASGKGKTAGKGTKGQLARSGPGLPGWFEGGQTPLHMRLPKLRGFRPPRQVKHVAVNVGQLKDYAQGGTVTPASLQAKGFLRPDQTVKVLGDGTVGEAYEVHAHAVSRTARSAIEAAGGNVVLIDLPSPGRADRGAAATRSSVAAPPGAAAPGPERGASPRAKSE